MKKIKLDVYATYGGENFAPGEHEVSEEAAQSFVEKKLGSLVGENSKKDAEEVATVDETDVFEPKEAVEKYLEGDSSEKVFRSLKAHQSEIIEFAKGEIERFHEKSAQVNSVLTEKTQADVEAKKNDAEPVAPVKTEEKAEVQTENAQPSAETSENEEIPKDFPKRNAFIKLGFKSVKEIQSLSKEKLTLLDGITAATAVEALAYGK